MQKESTSQIQPWCGDRKSTLANDSFPESLSRKSWDKEWLLSTNPRSRQTQDKVDASLSTGAGGGARQLPDASFQSATARPLLLAWQLPRRDRISCWLLHEIHTNHSCLWDAVTLGTKLKQIPTVKFWAFDYPCVNPVQLLFPISLGLPERHGLQHLLCCDELGGGWVGLCDDSSIPVFSSSLQMDNLNE